MFVGALNPESSNPSINPERNKEMLYLIGSIARVSDAIPDTNKKTGEVGNIWKVQVQHAKSDNANAELDLETIKLKTVVQAEAFRKCLGKTVRVPVQMYAFGDNPGLWIEKDVLPTVVGAETKAAA